MTPKLIRLLAAILIATLPVTATTKAEAATKRCPEYEPLLRKASLPVRTFSYIMWRESRCTPRAIGWNYKPGKSPRDCKLTPANRYRHCRAVASYDSGLLQVNSTWTTVTAQVCGSRWGDMSVLLKPRCNIAVAKYLYEQGGGLSNWGMRD